MTLCVDWLIKQGVDNNLMDNNGETAMHGAAYKSLPMMVRFLAVHGAKPEVWNRKNKSGLTPVIIAEGFRPGRPSTPDCGPRRKRVGKHTKAPPPDNLRSRHKPWRANRRKSI